MAKFRMVYTAFWEDAKVVEELTPEDKYFFLYLLTNAKTTQIGIYSITKRQMAFDLGYSMESVQVLLDRFVRNHEMIKYNPKTREIAIHNWGKYNLNRGGKPVLDCVEAELREVKDVTLIDYVKESVWKPELRELFEHFCDLGQVSDVFDESSTIRGQEEEKEKEEYKEKQQQEQQYALTQENVAKIVKFWDENGFGINNIHGKKQLLSWLDDTEFQVPEEVVLKALHIACENDVRKFKYVEAVLHNWHNASLLTVEEIEHHISKHKEKIITYDPARDRF